MTDIVPFIIAVILIVIGLAGILVPGLPDFFFIFLGVLVYGIWTSFETITVKFILIFLGLVILGYFLDWLGTVLGAKRSKATNFGILGAVMGGILGIFFGGLVGMVLFSLVGTIIFELVFAQKNLAESVKAGVGSLVGMIFGIILKLVLAGIMIGLFFSKVF